MGKRRIKARCRGGGPSGRVMRRGSVSGGECLNRFPLNSVGEGKLHGGGKGERTKICLSYGSGEGHESVNLVGTSFSLVRSLAQTDSVGVKSRREGCPFGACRIPGKVTETCGTAGSRIVFSVI